ncbi:MAG: hypothetical protein QG549_701 [Patescibacteria group bacterium]|nr:hypothetical protein [Patescibacteria group bacterium]
MKLLALYRHTFFQLLVRTLSTSFMVLCLVSSLIPSQLVFAAADRLYLSPSSSQMNIDTTFCVDVIGYADANADPGTATGTLNFDASRLQLVQVKPNGKKCPDSQGNDTAPSYYTNRTITTQNGAINFDESQSQADGGIRYLFAVTFKAQAAGTAQLSFASGSKLNGAQPTLKTGSYVINAPVSAPVTTPKPSTSTVPAPVVATTPKPDTQVKTPSNTAVVPETKTDPTGLIDGVIASPSYTTSSITWKVNAPDSSSSFRYGISSDKLDKTAEVKKSADGGYSVALSNLSPGIYYYYSIAASGAESTPGNYSSSFVTNGYPISIKITENNVPVQIAQVKIGEQTLTANNGSLTIGLASGNYSGTITTDTATLNINLTVKDVAMPSDGSAPATQLFGPYNLSSAPLSGGPGSNFSIFAFIGVLAGGTVVLAFGFIIFITYRRRKFESNSYTSSPSTTVIIEDGYDWHQNTSERPSDRPQAPEQEQTPLEPQRSIQTYEEIQKMDDTLDMFEKAGIPAPKSHDPTVQDSSHEMQQNPNSPHSTKP